MRAFVCPDCHHLVTFESTVCLHSNTPLGFDWSRREIVALGGLVPCVNRSTIGCNGLSAGSAGACRSCELTRTRPDDGDDERRERFREAEAAKRRLLFELLELGLPVVSHQRRRKGGLAFDFLDGAAGDVTTGHADGVITLDLAEADDTERERLRAALAEPYRTVLGTLRHEIGHYYQPILAPEGSPARDRVRAQFGDDRADYAQALDRHYAQGPPSRWRERFVSGYASTHPWEDWAETFAHYLHVNDTMQTAITYGIGVSGPALAAADTAPLYSFPTAAPQNIAGKLDAWYPLTYALNALNRSMGLPDAYPFVLSAPVVRKLELIDELARGVGVGPTG